ncbi:MAG: DUF2252 domain-containing protein [Acidobacteriaceae bacterium]|jgi:uncharacterized protein (DUF2252 family)
MSHRSASKQVDSPDKRLNMRKPLPTVEQLHAQGKAMRESVPRELHGQWKPHAQRDDVLSIIKRSNAGRQERLIPLRMERMAESPFAFLRGAVAVMAHDLFPTPTIGHNVVLAGDAHLGNFGLYGSPHRELVFDLNDFDETLIGPWEWDLKRLTASVNVAGRENGLSARERRVAVMQAVQGYQTNMARLEPMGTLDIWHLHSFPGRSTELRKVPAKAQAVIEKIMAKATRSDHNGLLRKVADKDASGHWRFREDPPILTRVHAARKKSLILALEKYSLTLTRELRYMLSRYRVEDVAHRVVGVGSVGTRAYLVLLIGKHDNDPLFLQVKEALVPAFAPYLPLRRAVFAHEGQRVVVGQRALQATSDVMLGWTEMDGRHYYVRQMKNLKGSVPVEWLTGDAFNFYAWACGALLARAHARTSEAATIAGYCGVSKPLRESFADWAEAYGDQTVADHARLRAHMKRG